MATIVVVALILFLAFFLIVRRRRDRRQVAIAPGSAALVALDARFAPDSEPAAAASDRIEPSGTLGGHSDVPSPPPGEAPSDQGGAAAG